jgi:hypothetical protein
MRPDYLDAVSRQLAIGGLRRILDNGAFFPDCRHLASSFTASSLATLATGSWPAQHGIIADRWFDRSAQKQMLASADALSATTLAAEILAGTESRAYVVSLGALEGTLFAGSSEARVFHVDRDGRFVTPGEEPAWLNEYNRLKPLENLRGAEWLALGAGAGAPPLRILRFDPNRSDEFLSLYKASPFGQRAQFEFLAELVSQERLGQGNTFDFVCLLAGSTELLGYETGARSALMKQMMLQFDRHLEFLLGRLDTSVGASGYNLVLAGAHGAPPEPSSEARPRMSVNGEFLAQAIQRQLADQGGLQLARYLYPFLYLDTKGFLDPEPLRQAAGRVALAQPPVAAFYTAGGHCSVHDEFEQRFRNSFHSQRAGDLMLSYHPEYVEDYDAARGISYGSLYNYDVRTPLCFYGPQFRAAVFESPVESIDVAPTLARAIGVPAPSSSTGRVLGEAFGGYEEKSK